MSSAILKSYSSSISIASYLFISHDIDVVYQMSDRIMVMQEGKISEIGENI